MRRLIIIVCVLAAFGSLALLPRNSAPRRPSSPVPVSLPANGPTPDAKAIDADLDKFCWRGRPIHPGVVYLLNYDVANVAAEVAAVDLQGACESQRVDLAPEKDHGYLRYKDPDEFGAEGSFAYKHLGRSTDGQHVLLTVSNSGGSGSFMDIQIVRFTRDRINEDGRVRDRVRMTLVGHFTLGDRDDGKVEVRSDKLIIGKSRYRDSEKVIDLKKDIPGGEGAGNSRVP